MLRNVPLYLHRGDSATEKWLWRNPRNQFQLKLFLKLHGIDIDDVVEIHFSNQNFRPLIMERDEEGRPVVDEGGYNVKCVEKKVRYLTSKPTWD